MSGMKLKKGDRVRVLSGKDVGKEGEITRVIPERDRVIIDGVNVAKRHQRATRATMQGGIIDKDMPIHVSNVALFNPATKKADRSGVKVLEGGKKVRVFKDNGEQVDA